MPDLLTSPDGLQGQLYTSVPAGTAAIGNANTVSKIARGQAVNVLKSNGTIDQTSERLFSARARYARLDQSYLKGGLDTEGNQVITEIDAAGNRGDWAFIKLVTSKGQASEYITGNTKRDLSNKKLVGPASVGSDMANSYTGVGYDRFLITGVSCQMSEKVQISEVFGDGEVVYYFGRQPLIFNISGLLIDSADNDWFYLWLSTYSDFLRGTQTAKNYELLKIVLPNMVITGTMSGFSWSQESNRDTDIPFQFQFIAKTVEPRPATGGALVRSNKLEGVNFTNVAKFLPQSQINSFKGQVANLSSVIQSPTASLRDKSNALNQLGAGVGGSFGAALETSKGTLTGFQKTIDGWTAAEGRADNAIRTSALFQTVTSSLNGIRANLFSPIYGILSSLTKLVSNTTRSVNGIFNSLINPVRNILRDITNISNQAIALVNLVNNSITGVGRNINSQLKGLRNDYKTAIKTLNKAAGTIAAAPVSAAQSVRLMFSSGSLSLNSVFLRSQPTLSFVRPSINILGVKPPTRLALLTGTAEYSSKTANSL